MNALDLLTTIGRAPRGTRFTVIAPLDAYPDGGKGKDITERLQPGIQIEVLYPHDGPSFYGVADLGGVLRGYLIEFRWFHCLKHISALAQDTEDQNE
jgi:hypothetical protein